MNLFQVYVVFVAVLRLIHVIIQTKDIVIGLPHHSVPIVLLLSKEV